MLSAETWNVRLCLCSYGFSPFNMSMKSYLCCHVMTTPYNLFRGCVWRYVSYGWLLWSPTSLILTENWYIYTHDLWLKIYLRFGTKGSIHMWTISNFPANGMLSEWSTTGRLGCPYKKFSVNKFFDCYGRFLIAEHSYRHSVTWFHNGRAEYNHPIHFRTGQEIYNIVAAGIWSNPQWKNRSHNFFVGT